MKLLTLNCHSWQEEHQHEKIATLAEVIGENNYDVVALQEVSQLIESTPVNNEIHDDNYAEVLVKELHKRGFKDYHYRWTINHLAYDLYQEGVAILTKHPIKNAEAVPLTESTDPSYWKTRVALKITIDYDGEDYDFFSCHLGWWHDSDEPAKNQLTRLLAAVDSTKQTFLLGDFNNEASQRDEGYDHLLTHGWLDTYKMATKRDSGTTVPGKIKGWDNDAKAKRIDYIFSNNVIPVSYSQVIFNGENKPIVSDHYGVEIKIN